MLGSRTEISLIVFVFFIFSLIPGFSEESSDLILETNNSEYNTGDEMIISGFVKEKKMPVVALQIFDPNGNILSANQVNLNEDNSFSKTISLDSPFYDDAGTYLITMNYGKLKTETNFVIIGTADTQPSITEDDFELFMPEIITIFTDKEIYQNGDTVTVIGLVSDKNEESVLIGIYDPFGTPAGFYFADVDSNLEFSTSFLVKSGVNFKTEGTYSISGFYGESEEITIFDYIEQKVTSDSSSNNIKSETKNSQKEITKPIQTPKTPTQQAEQKTESTTKLENKKQSSKKSDNLSVEDIELGIMLNQIKLNCDSSELMDTISYHDGMGPALIRLCKYPEAIYYYDQSLASQPNNIEILNNKGSALAKLGLYDEAIIHYDSALDVDKNNILVLNNKANALSNIGHNEEAISLYHQVLSLQPDNLIVRNNLQTVQDKAFILSSIPALPSQSEPEPTIISIQEEQKSILVVSSNQESNNLLEQIGNAIVSLFSFLS